MSVKNKAMNTAQQALALRFFREQFTKWVEATDIAEQYGLTREELIDSVEFKFFRIQEPVAGIIHESLSDMVHESMSGLCGETDPMNCLKCIAYAGPKTCPGART